MSTVRYAWQSRTLQKKKMFLKACRGNVKGIILGAMIINNILGKVAVLIAKTAEITGRICTRPNLMNTHLHYACFFGNFWGTL